MAPVRVGRCPEVRFRPRRRGRPHRSWWSRTCGSHGRRRPAAHCGAEHLSSIKLINFKTLTLQRPDLSSDRVDSPVVPNTALPVREKAFAGPGVPSPKPASTRSQPLESEDWNLVAGGGVSVVVGRRSRYCLEKSTPRRRRGPCCRCCSRTRSPRQGGRLLSGARS